MAELSSAARENLDKGDFAIPEKAPGPGSYPIHDEAHARNALARVKQHGTKSEQRRVIAKVRRRFPDIDVDTKPSEAAQGAAVFGGRAPHVVINEAMTKGAA